jgi:serine/threonine protein kinase
MSSEPENLNGSCSVCGAAIPGPDGFSCSHINGSTLAEEIAIAIDKVEAGLPLVSVQAQTLDETLGPAEAQPSVHLDSGSVEKIKRCPACDTDFPGVAVVCKHDGTLLIPVRRFDKTKLFGTIYGYTLGAYLGEGDLTEVLSVTEDDTGISMVAKFMRPHIVGDAKTVKRFLAKFPDIVKLNHPNIGTCFSGGLVKYKSSMDSNFVDRPFLIVEQLKGPNLKTVLSQSGEFEAAEVARLMILVCSALEYAEQQGVMHLDLKPSNIYLELAGDTTIPKLVDFGVSERMFRYLDFNPPEMEQGKTASLYGDYHYTSPEVAFGGTLDAPAQMYSLGCIMYEAVTGKKPFTGNNSFDVLMKHRYSDPPPLPKGIKSKFASIVMQCLKNDPAKRPQTYTELVKELERCKF